MRREASHWEIRAIFIGIVGHVDDAPICMDKQLVSLPVGAPARRVDAATLAAMFNPPRSERTIRNWQASRMVPFYKVGRAVLFNPDEVFAHLDKYHRVNPAGGPAT